jgi:hypothetical protein
MGFFTNIFLIHGRLFLAINIFKRYSTGICRSVQEDLTKLWRANSWSTTLANQIGSCAEIANIVNPPGLLIMSCFEAPQHVFIFKNVKPCFRISDCKLVWLKLAIVHVHRNTSDHITLLPELYLSS